MLKKQFALFAVVVLIISLLAGCAADETTAPPADDPAPVDEGPVFGGQITYGLVGDPPTFNSILSTDTTSGWVLERIANALVRTDENRELIGDLAEEWAFNEEDLTLTFNLREGVTWSDGEEFTADDVVYTFNAIQHDDYTGVRKKDLLYVDEIYAEDDYTVVFKLNQPDATLISKLVIEILPEHVFAGTPIAELKEHVASNQTPIYTGPYVLDEWVSGERLVLKAREDYWGEGPYIETILCRFYEDDQVMLASLENGDIDYMANIPVEDVERVKSSLADEFEFVETPNNGYDYIGLKQTHPILKDLKVRQALVHAIDREEMIDTVYQGYGTVINSHWIPISWAYTDDTTTYEYDPEQAIALLEEAGWTEIGDDGIRLNEEGERLSFEVVCNAGSTKREMILSIVEGYWKDIGVEASMEYYEWSVLLDQYLDVAKFEAYLLGWSLGIDPDAYIFFHSDASVDENGVLQGFNDVEYKNDRVDALLEEGRTTFDMGRRKEIYKEVGQILSEELPYIFLVTQNLNRAMHKKVKGVVWSKVAPIHPEKWWIDPAFH